MEYSARPGGNAVSLPYWRNDASGRVGRSTERRGHRPVYKVPKRPQADGETLVVGQPGKVSDLLYTHSAEAVFER